MPSRKRSRIPGPRKTNSINNIICVSDLHSGCKLALCPPAGIRKGDGIVLDDGGTYIPSVLQMKLYGMWREFWDIWVPFATKGEPYAVVLNGDAVEGNHHRASTPISVNPEDQCRIAEQLLRPVVDKAAAFYMVRGTEAHVGISAAAEEALAKRLGAKPNAEGQHCRWDLWKQIGDGKLVHFLHHVGTTSSQAYESTAVYKELTEMYIESARWCRQPPSIVVRSHRHRSIQVIIPVGEITSYKTGDTVMVPSEARVIVTPAWQGKTPFAWKIPGARIATPQFGGICIRWSDDKVLYAASKVWTVDRSPVE